MVLGETSRVDSIGNIYAKLYELTENSDPREIPFAKDALTKTVTFLRTNAGAAVAGTLGTLGLLHIARSKEGEENKNLRTALYVGAAATTALTAIAVVLGFKSGFNANFV